MKYSLFILAFLNFCFVNSQIEKGMIAHFSFNGKHIDNSSKATKMNVVGTTFGPDRNSNANQAIVIKEREYISFNNNLVKPSLPLTISTWVKVNSIEEPNIIFCSDQVYANYYGYWFQTVEKTGQVGISFGGGIGTTSANNRKTFVSDVQLNPGVWYHVTAIIRDHNDMSIYVNGDKSRGEYNGTGLTHIVYSNAASKIGAGFEQIYKPEGYFFTGSIDELSIWNRALSPSEISNLADEKKIINENKIKKTPLKVIKIVNELGQELDVISDKPLTYIYNDGSTKQITVNKKRRKK